MPDAPLRALRQEEIEAYDRDGVICARGLFTQAWVDRMAAAVDRTAAHPTFYGSQVSLADQGFAGDLFVWKQDDDFRDFVYDSPAAAIAQQLLRSRRVNFFYDQLFVKPPGCHVATPWHHDVTFWPVRGRQLCSIWMSFDAVDRENSGLEFIRGSQHWPQRFKAITPDYNAYMMASDLADPPEIEGHRNDYDLLSWELQPGDVLLFDGLVVHGSDGNHTTERPRRAFSTRWAGDDVRFDPRTPTMPLFWEHGLAAGDELGGPLFPQLLPHPIAEEGATRARGPEPPSPEMLEAARQAIGKHMATRSEPPGA